MELEERIEERKKKKIKGVNEGIQGEGVKEKLKRHLLRNTITFCKPCSEMSR
jgi:hypothetical protein